jgi:hypothetical protein
MSNKDYYQGQQQSGYYPPPQGKFGHSFSPFPYLSSPIRSATRTGGLLPSAAAAIIPRSAIRWAPVRSGRLSTATPTQHGLCVSSDHKEQNPCASTNCATTTDNNPHNRRVVEVVDVWHVWLEWLFAAVPKVRNVFQCILLRRRLTYMSFCACLCHRDL